MTITRICRSMILVVSLVVFHTAAGQYQDPFAMLSTSKQIQPPKERKATSRYVDLFNPLGPRAQNMRYKSYSCIEKPVSYLEKGLWIKLGSKLFHYKDQSIQMLSEEQQLVNINIYDYNIVLKKTVSALKSLERRSPYAQNMIRTLQNSDNKFTIALVSTTDSYTLFPLPDNRLGVLNNNAYAFQVIESESLVVDYAPFNQIGSGAEIRWAPEHKKIKLAHELSHAYDANYGLVDDKLMHSNGEIMSAREIRALYHENRIRKEMNLRLRVKANTGGALIWEGTPYTYPLPVPARY